MNSLSDVPAVTFVPDLLYAGGRFVRGHALVCDAVGRIIAVTPLAQSSGGEEFFRTGVGEGAFTATTFAGRVERLPGRALLPGMVNAHSHAFQRVIRGRTEHRAAARDSFWTWREMMYSAAARLTPEDLYDASRMAFLEMTLGGVTTVGEFHYLHRTAEGAEYDDPNLLAREVVRAGRDCGLRVALLRVAYARAGHQRPADERQRRFIEPDPETYLRHTEALAGTLAREAEDAGGPPEAWVGCAPHSVRAVPFEYLKEVGEFAAARSLPVHMHVAEQPAEVSASVEETGLTPVALAAAAGLVGERFTGVHAVHVTPEEVALLGGAAANVCACPTTERNLGDGVVPADALLEAGVTLSLGTDSHAQIDLLEDARELEYHLRLQRLERNVLARPKEEAGDDARPDLSELAARLFACATAGGARGLGLDAGELAPGRAADFFTVDLSDPTVAGAGETDLLPAVVFSLSRAAVCDTYVGARAVVASSRHPRQEEIIARFNALQRRLWA